MPTPPRHLPAPHAAQPDEVLVQALRADDAGAFAELYERYWQRLFEAAYRRLGGREAAEEVVQDVFVTFWHKRHEHAIQHVAGYLLTAVKYRVIDALRARQTQASYREQLAHGPLHLAGQDHCTEETVAADDLALALLHGLRALPGHTREVFRLSRLEHQSVPEIAVRLNLSRKTVEYHLTRALKALRVTLRDFLLLLLLLRWWA